jgi:DNA-binding NarL/FixJ family response regulator
MIDGDAQGLGTGWECVEAGMVRGIVPFNVNLDVLLSILRILLKGGEYFPASACRSGGLRQPKGVSENETPLRLAEVSDEPCTLELTGREMEILAAVARGRKNKNIAADLHLSEHTVKLHIHNIITKLGVHNRTEAAVKFLERAHISAASDRHASIDDGGIATSP